jgi:hypothetical protein
MSGNGATAATAAKPLTDFLLHLLGASHVTRELWRDAVAALGAAAIQTRGYVSDVERGQRPTDRETEMKLAVAWQQAGAKFYALDPILAERCHLKAGYWAQPNLWTDEQVREAGIALSDVERLTAQLLTEKRPRPL